MTSYSQQQTTYASQSHPCALWKIAMSLVFAICCVPSLILHAHRWVWDPFWYKLTYSVCLGTNLQLNTHTHTLTDELHTVRFFFVICSRECIPESRPWFTIHKYTNTSPVINIRWRCLRLMLLSHLGFTRMNGAQFPIVASTRHRSYLSCTRRMLPYFAYWCGHEYQIAWTFYIGNQNVRENKKQFSVIGSIDKLVWTLHECLI